MDESIIREMTRVTEEAGAVNLAQGSAATARSYRPKAGGAFNSASEGCFMG